MSKTQEDLFPVVFFSEITTIDQLMRNRISSSLPKGMEISHFSLLNHLSFIKTEITPVQLAKNFHVTKGAMTNTLAKLEAFGYIHVRPNWTDARSKKVSISKTGLEATQNAMNLISPLLSNILNKLEPKKTRVILPILREIRILLDQI